MRTANLLSLLLSFVLVHCLAPTRFSANANGLDVSAKPPKDHPKDTVDTHATSGSMTKGDGATKGHGDSKGHGDGPEGHWEWKPDPESTDHANVYPNGKGHSKDHHNVHPSDQASCQISCKNNYKFFHTSYKLSFTGCGGPDGNERELHESIKGGACATTFWKWDVSGATIVSLNQSVAMHNRVSST